MSERGAIINPPMVIDGNSVRIGNSALDAQELRSALLFWDRLDFPESMGIRLGASPEVQLLIDSGLMERTQVPHNGLPIGGLSLRHAIETAFEAHEAADPGAWAVLRGPKTVTFADEEFEPDRGGLARIYGALPVPDASVPIYEVLEFRERRRSEMLALRSHLDRVHQRIANSVDPAHAALVELEDLDRAIADSIKTARETNFVMRLVDIGINFNLVAGAIAGVGAAKLGLPLSGSLLAAGAAGLTISAGPKLKRRGSSTAPFQYVTQYGNELR